MENSNQVNNQINNSNVDWQLTKTTLKDRVVHLLGKELMSDMTFLVGPDKVRIPSHRIFLSVTSNCFYNALYLFEPDNMELPVADVDVPVFMKFLEYIYSGEIDLNWDVIFDIVKLAKRFDIPHLDRLCLEFQCKNLSIKNVIKVMTETEKLLVYDELWEKSLDMIRNDTYVILKQEEFLNATPSVVRAIFQQDSLKCREVDVYEAALKWSEKECIRKNLELSVDNKRKVLGKIFYLIRFPAMTFAELADCAKDDSILTAIEIRNLFLFLTMKYNGDIKFISTPRNIIGGVSYKTDNFDIFRRFSQWKKSGRKIREHHLWFTVTESLELIGIGLLASPSMNNKNEGIHRTFGDSTVSTNESTSNTFKIKICSGWLPLKDETIQTDNCLQNQLDSDFNVVRIFFSPEKVVPQKPYNITIECDETWEIDGDAVHEMESKFRFNLSKGNIMELLYK